MFEIEDYNDIPGMIMPSQCEDIIKIAKSLPNNATVIEIGCAWGKSTWSWIQGLPKDSSLITIDIFALDERKRKHANRQALRNNPKIDNILSYWMENTGYDTLLKILEEHPRKDLIKHKVYRGTSDSFDLGDIEYLDCVYIDGNHKYQFVKHDLEKFGNISNIVCGDDYKPLGKSGSFKPQVGVVQAVDEFCKKTGRKFWTDPQSFFWTALK